jgi:hypothetical protein
MVNLQGFAGRSLACAAAGAAVVIAGKDTLPQLPPLMCPAPRSWPIRVSIRMPLQVTIPIRRRNQLGRLAPGAWLF